MLKCFEDFFLSKIKIKIKNTAIQKQSCCKKFFLFQKCPENDLYLNVVL